MLTLRPDASSASWFHSLIPKYINVIYTCKSIPKLNKCKIYGRGTEICNTDNWVAFDTYWFEWLWISTNWKSVSSVAKRPWLMVNMHPGLGAWGHLKLPLTIKGAVDDASDFRDVVRIVIYVRKWGFGTASPPPPRSSCQQDFSAADQQWIGTLYLLFVFPLPFGPTASGVGHCWYLSRLYS